MKKYLAALCALFVLCLGSMALAETEIQLSDAGVEVGAGVEVDDTAITIRENGTYRLTGTMTEGNIVVEADDVELVWDGAQLASSTQAPLTAHGGLRLTLPEGANGAISDLRRREGGEDAAIVAGGAVTVGGEGALSVTAQVGHGLRAAALYIEGGTLSVLSSGDGAHLEAGGDEACFVLSGGQLVADAGGCGVYAGGDAEVTGGDLRVDANADGLYVEGALDIRGGAMELNAGAGGSLSSPTSGASASSSSGASPTSSFYSPFFGYDPFELFFGDPFFGGYDDGYDDGGFYAPAVRGYDALSAAEIHMEDGSLVLNASGDGLRADGTLDMAGGALSIACGGDGLRAGGALDVSGGVIWVDECEVGLAGTDVSVGAAEVSIVSTETGVSAVSVRGGDASVLEGAQLSIVSGGDGIEAGADVYLEGGETQIWCSGRNGAPIRADGDVFSDGGTLVAGGNAEAAAVSGDSTQPLLHARFNATLRAGVRVVVEDGSGEAVFSVEPEEGFSVLLLTSPALQEGGAYTLYVEGEALGWATVDGAEAYFSGDSIDGRGQQPDADETPRGTEPALEDGVERI